MYIYIYIERETHGSEENLLYQLRKHDADILLAKDDMNTALNTRLLQTYIHNTTD